jgi:hypothetical protein
MIRFIHVRERNLIIMCMMEMDSTFSSSTSFLWLRGGGVSPSVEVVSGSSLVEACQLIVLCPVDCFSFAGLLTSQPFDSLKLP